MCVSSRTFLGENEIPGAVQTLSMSVSVVAVVPVTAGFDGHLDSSVCFFTCILGMNGEKDMFGAAKTICTSVSIVAVVLVTAGCNGH